MILSSAPSVGTGRPTLTLGEWQAGTIDGVTLSARDRVLADRLARGRSGTRTDVREHPTGVTVQTRASVGLVSFSGFDLRVEPKLSGDHTALFRMLDFVNGLPALRELLGTPRLRFVGHDLLDFVVLALTRLSEQLVVAGLRSDYVEREGPLPAIRGRFMADRQQLERFGMLDQLVCRYDEHEHDIPDNQLLAAALARGSVAARDAQVRRRARTLAALLGEVCDPTAFHRDHAELLTYDRLNAHYKDAHALALLLLDGIGPDESLRDGPQRVQSFLVDMDTLFEQFVDELIRQVVHGHLVEVVRQRNESIFRKSSDGKHYAHVRPDIILKQPHSPDARIPLDAKYKRYGDRRIDAGDLTQVFLYAYAFRSPGDTAPPRGLLVYPTERVGPPEQLDLDVRSVIERNIDARLTALGIHIPTTLNEIQAGCVGPTVDALRSAVVEF